MQRKGTTARFAFNVGEVSPKMAGRVDIDRVTSSCRQLQNMIVITHGAATRRPGLQYIAAAKESE